MRFGPLLGKLFSSPARIRRRVPSAPNPERIGLECLEDRLTPADLFWNAASPSLGGSPVAIVQGDFNQDGKLDFASATSKSLTIGLGLGIGSFGPPQTMTLGDTPQSLAVADMNGDGKLDIIAVNSASESITFLQGRGDGTFALHEPVPVGAEPAAVAIADFSGDGFLDLAVANAGNNTISLLLGDGHGAFTPSVSLPLGTVPSWIAAGDFDNDKKADLAVANSSGNSVSILMGMGNGIFASAGTVAVGSFPKFILVEDLNKDGKQDLATANYIGNSISVALGQGNGQFQTAQSVALGASTAPQQIALGDFNKDGRWDLAAVNFFGNSVSLATGNGDGTFKTPTKYAVGHGPESLVVGDFDNDARADIVTVNHTDSSASFLFGKTDGGFFPANHLYFGAKPQAVAVDDFNGDGKNDIVTANGEGSTLSLLLGNGNGTFQNPLALAVGSQPSALAVADFNNDGILDIAAANNDSNTVSILLGFGDGTFQFPQTISGLDHPTAIGALDLNGDKRSDFLVANGGSGTLAVFLANADGTYKASPTVGLGASVQSLAFADFNGDTKIDVAATNLSTNTVSVLLGNGDGSFQPAASFGVGAGPLGLAAGDVNGDGKADLISANSSAATLSFLAGNGNGTFKAAVSLAVGDNPSSVVIADIDQDKRADLISTDGGSGTMTVLLGNANGTWKTPAFYGLGANPRQIALGEFNGDQKIDLVSANQDDANLSILLGTGNGGFQSPPSLEVGPSPWSLIKGDFNGDGKLDLATANSGDNTLSVLLSLGAGAFAPALSVATGSSPVALSMADVNGDGKLDLITANNLGNSVSLLIGNGNGTFKAAKSFAVGLSPAAVRLGDVNGDGKLDILTANGGDNSLSVLLGNGDGAFKAAKSVAAGGASPHDLLVLDLNGDQKLDLVSSNSGSNTLTILLGNGDGSFQAPSSVALGANPYSLVAGDFNGDLKVDLVAANAGGTSVSVLLGLGNGSFQNALTWRTGVNPWSVATDDIDGDGNLDLVTANAGDNSVGVLLGTGIGGFLAPRFYQVGANPYSLVIGDFDKDRRPDLAVANFNGSTVSLLTGISSLAPAIVSAKSTHFTEKRTGQFTLLGTGLPAPIFALVSGTLPAGVTFDAASGLFSGKPAQGTAGEYLVKIEASNGLGVATQNFTLIVDPSPGDPPAFTSAASATFEYGKTGSFQMSAEGTPNPVFSVSVGTLPAGLTLDPATGLLSGKADAGIYLWTISASNGIGSPATQNFTLTVNKANLTITADKKTKVYGAALPALTATYAGLVNGDTAASILGLNLTTTALASSKVGDYSIVANNAAALNYNITFVNGTLSVTPASLTIRPDDKTKVYGAALPALSVSYSGLVNGDLASIVSGLVLSTSATSSSKVGTYSVGASKATASNYTITFVDGVLAVTPAALTIKAEDKAKVYGAALPSFTATYAGLVNGDSSSVVSGLVLSASATASSGVGDYKISASKATASNYAISFVDGKLTVTKAALTIKADDKTKVYGAALPALSATFTGLVNGDTSGVVSGLLLTTTASAASNAGDYSISASKAVAANYTISFADGKLTVAKAALTIKAEDKTKVYGAALPSLTSTITGLVNGDKATVVSGLALGTTALASSQVGDYAITASKATAANYTIAFAPGKLTVSKAALSIKADDKTKVYGAAMPALTATYSGLVNGDAANVVTGLTLTSTALASSNVGDYKITAAKAVSANYDISFVEGKLTVSKAALTIKADDKTKVYGAALPALTATYTGLVKGDAPSVVSGLTLTTTALAASGAGDYKITASKATAANYNITLVEGKLTVSKAALSIKADNKAKLAGAANPALTATFSGFVNGDTPAVVSGLQLKTTATAASPRGSYPITLSGATAANYAITLVNGTLTVGDPPKITSAASVAYTYGKAGTFTFTASGNPAPTFQVTAGAIPAGLTLDQKTGLLSGTPTANAGTYKFSVAPSNGLGSGVAQNFTLTVNRAALTITAENKTKIYGTMNPALTVVYKGLVNGDTSSKVTGLSLSTTALTTSKVGNYPIVVSKAIAANYAITFVNGTMAITKANLTITADNKSRLAGVANPPLTATFTGLVNGDKASVVTGLTLTTTATAASKAGTYAITAKGGVAANYNITLVSGLLSVNQAPAFTSAKTTTFTSGKAGSFQLAVTGFPASTFSVVQGSLPAGVMLNATTGLLSSLNTAKAGTYSFTLQASNGIGVAAKQVFSLKIQ